MKQDARDFTAAGLRATASALTLALALTVPVVAQNAAPEEQPEIAEVEVTSSVVIFHPVVSTEGITVTAAGGDGCFIERTFEPGETPYFEPYDDQGEPIENGSFTIELRANSKISGDIKDMLRAARKRGEPSEPLAKKLRKLGKLPPGPLVQNVYVGISNGKFVDPNKREPGAELQGEETSLVDDLGSLDIAVGNSNLDNISAADFVINDDLIVDGSACIGFDCVNGESFSFDTIRLKENNLRIKFDDTSTAASFPSTDWQLTANASANGGASKFSIDDISGSRTPFTVEANARSHSLYVDDGGRIGNRTSTPSTEIHTIDGDTPTLRLQQDGSSGFAPQTWDVAGNETNFFVRDVSNGSQLPFRIRPGAPTDSLFVDVDGHLGLGTASPGGHLHIKDGADDVMLVDVGSTAASGSTMQIFSPDGTSGSFFSQALDSGLVLFGAQTNSNFAIRTNGTTDVIRITTVPRVGILNTSPTHPLHVGTDATNGNGAHVTTAGVWTNGSSRKNKTNIHNLELDEAMAAFAELQPVRYMGVNDVTEEEYMGFIAEDVPELVAMGDRAGLAAMDIVAVLTKVVQAQNELVEAQSKTIKELDMRLRGLEEQRSIQ
ncbi:MAG: tail fiber domain-containing protein [Deltaproteobacteria bacterium]|nr:tail fiber domain-containing protein [Deltaproteobacteria bacterium]